MRINYKMLTTGFVLVAIMVMLLSTAAMAAPNNQGKNGNAAYGAQQNGSGQQNCQGNCDGNCDQGTCDGDCDQSTCDGNCDQNKEKGPGKNAGNGINGRQGSAGKGQNRGCDGTCTEQ